MPPSTDSVDITRLNRAARRKAMRGGKIRFMIPGRNLPYVKKSHGEISNFYFMREKELAEEKKQHTKEQIQNAAAIGNSAKLTPVPVTELDHESN